MADENGERETPSTSQITVFNQTYRVTSSDNGERASRVARLVDARMRETASQITTHDTARIAVLTALQIADDLLRLEEMYKREGEVTAAPDEGAADGAAGGGGEASPAAPRGTWFESIFDTEAPPDSREGRMGSSFSERLRTARQTEAEGVSDGPERSSD